MFNLLRRSRQRKLHKSTSDEEDKSNKESSPCPSGSLRQRESERQAKEEHSERAQLPAHRRAVIEELEDFADDSDEEQKRRSSPPCVKLAKTAANGRHSEQTAAALSPLRSNKRYINNTGQRVVAGAVSSAVLAAAAAALDDDPNVAADSPNETASANANTNANANANGNGKESASQHIEKVANQLIGNCHSPNIGPLIDGRPSDTVTVVARRERAATNEEATPRKSSSRLSLKSFAALPLALSGSNSNTTNGTVQDLDCETTSTPLSVTKKRKTLQKSRDFLSEIFMARGRNHQRQQQQQQQQKKQQQQQQVQQISGKCHTAEEKKSNKSNDNDNSSNHVIDQAALARRLTHLETNSDPATATAAASTNSYQMTMSNNRPEKHGQRAEEQPQPESELKRERRSNSAGAAPHQRPERRERHRPSESVENHGRAMARSCSAEPRDASPSRDFIQAANVVEWRRTVARHAEAAEQREQQQQQQPGNATLQQGEQQQQQQQASDIIMGQTSAKPNETATATATASAHSSRASTPREFRESVVSPPQAPPRHHKSQDAGVPQITVEDCSFESFSSNEEQEEQKEHLERQKEPQEWHKPEPEVYHDFDNGLNIEELNEANIETLEDEVFATDIPSTIYQNANGRPWTRLSHVKLENVQEEAEEEDDEEQEEDEDEVDEAVDLEYQHHNPATPSGNSRQSASSERSALKSDSNLSSSYADSGIGVHDEEQQQKVPQQQAPQPPPRSSSATSATQSLLQQRRDGRSPFTRDGYSTDCEETLLQCDELDDERDLSERLVCIESISLPDVVVESTTASTTTATASTTNGSSNSNLSTEAQININIANGAGGNSLGNVHFIPIHIEGRSRSNSPNKQRSRDDSCLGESLEITEDGSVLNKPARQEHSYETHELRKELKQQKARFNSQLDEAHKNVHQLEAKVGEMHLKIQKLEQELSLKQWNVERLQGELSAAHTDDEYVRKKLKFLEDEKVHLRHKYSEDQDEYRLKYDELEAQYNDLTEKYKQTQGLASSLQTQLAGAQAEAEEWRQQVESIRGELDEQIRILKNALDNSEAERKICEDKWQKEFEMLRTHNREREETLMTDCEWQLRQMQRQCKDKMDKSNYERKQASAKAEELELELQSRRKEAEHLRVCQAQVNSLRGVVGEQEQTIQTLMDRIENLKSDLATANESLEAQIEAVHKIKYQCDNAIYDKERQMIYKIDEVRNEAAAFWENKLYTEMTRLTNELESVYVDERRDALDKLQNEHIEELRALTNRYTANEEELRAEIDELHENLELKKQDFLTLRERSDNALLQTRMHLDRADREYQNAMCREEDRRVELEERLKKEFEEEKTEMEEKFRERLGQVKDEFAKELQLSTQDMVESHRKELDSQKAKLQAERDEALQDLVDRHRAKIAAADERFNDLELRHQRNLKDLKAAYDAEKAALDKRDISNANEIEQLHRKCRCLTNLFEEMRMRYERRDPRAEDLREISELRTRCESQERDLYVLTDRLRDMQNQMSEMQQNGKAGGKSIKKPPPKTLPTSCDVIYEENEERESPEQESGSQEDDEEEEEHEQEPSDTESNHTIEINGKDPHLNEDDAHLITAV
ncbi:myosin-9 isoform X1 [Drosophila subobscura]|uniref:myosin-9 isoform X1 n=2 Tax=Drosophila subobscura TaxID=7241 RepID=UPI00155A4CDB|nr:myosin-9 isoform X1 [Drosophila subobscura]